VRCARAIANERKNNQGASPSIPAEIDKGVAAALGLWRRNLPSTGAALGREVVEGVVCDREALGAIYTEGEGVEQRGGGVNGHGRFCAAFM
jgi:hypothetical protein